MSERCGLVRGCFSFDSRESWSRKRDFVPLRKYCNFLV